MYTSLNCQSKLKEEFSVYKTHLRHDTSKGVKNVHKSRLAAKSQTNSIVHKTHQLPCLKLYVRNARWEYIVYKNFSNTLAMRANGLHIRKKKQVPIQRPRLPRVILDCIQKGISSVFLIRIYNSPPQPRTGYSKEKYRLCYVQLVGLVPVGIQFSLHCVDRVSLSLTEYTEGSRRGVVQFPHVRVVYWLLGYTT